MRKRLFNTTCPDDEMLADYLEGRLSGHVIAEMEAHLSACDTCLEAFMVSRHLIKEAFGHETTPVPDRVVQSTVRLIQDRITTSPEPLIGKAMQYFRRLYINLSDLFSPIRWGDWRLVPVRGSIRRVSGNLFHLKKSFDGIDVEIEVNKSGEGKANIKVFLPIVDKGKGIRVTLNRGEREISSNLLDAGSYVLFEDMPFNQYNLAFARDGIKLGTYHFKIKETHFGRR